MIIEFCRDISDLQVPHVAPVILPQLLRVLLQHQVRTSQATPPYLCVCVCVCVFAGV